MENQEPKIIYNPTCIITGKTDKLRMYAHRNEKGDMIGWFFLHEDETREGIEIVLTIKQ